jgi:hypothetical protein
MSDATTTTTATSTTQPPEGGFGLGLGIVPDVGLTPPERAYVLGERMWSGDGAGSGGRGSGRGRKLKKTRLVEGDWELVRTDQDWRDVRPEERKRVAQVQGGGDGTC